MGNSHTKINIGYVLPLLQEDLSILIMKGIQDRVKALDVNLFCMMGQKIGGRFSASARRANRVYELIDKQNVDGIIVWDSQLVTTYGEDIERFYRRIKEQNIFLVGVSNPIKGNISCVISDDEEGIRAAMTHLIREHGRRKIAFACAQKEHYGSRTRLEAYKKVLQEYGIPYDERLVTGFYGFGAESGKKAAVQLFDHRRLKPGEDIEAIVAASDLIACSLEAELQKRKIKCPEQIAIIGFDNNQFAKMAMPALTTIDPGFMQQGDNAVKMLVDLINNKVGEQMIKTPTRLITRNSCGCDEININKIKIRNVEKIDEINVEDYFEVIKTIEKKIMPFYYTLDKTWVENLVISFIYDIENSEGNVFNSFLQTYLDVLAEKADDIANFQSVITIMRNELMPMLHDYESIVRASDIWNKARLRVTREMEAVQNNKMINEGENVLRVYMTEQSLMSNFTLNEMLHSIERVLKNVNVVSCYIAIYDTPEDVLKKARLIFAYTNQVRNKIDDDYFFNPKEIIPKKFKSLNRRYSCIVNALYYKDVDLGYVVYETDTIRGYIFDTLSGQISSALYRTQIIGQLKDAENRNSILLDELARKNLELESKIEERTAAIKKVNNELQLAIIQTKEASEAKTRFLANMSHEIRTPLNCIIGFAEELQSMTQPNERFETYSSLIVQESDKLLNLVNDILDISKIEAGHMVLNNEVFDLYNLLENINSTYSMLAEGKGLYYRVVGLESAPRMLVGDFNKLRQILLNIVSNALKFTQKGGIIASIDVLSDNIDSYELKFSVKDTGIGIPKKRQKNIFEKFVQAEDSTTRKYGGTGLGTSIAKQLVELMGGTIGLESKVDVGSTFWFILSFKKPTEEMLKQDKNAIHKKNIAVSKQVLKNCTIMLVEDYEVNRQLAKVHLSKFGCKVIEKVNGKEAVECFKDNDIDLILMDIQMAEMDGCQATEIIRSTPKGKNVPIIGMTANVFKSDIDHYIDIGMNDVITKPFNKRDFQYKILFWIDRSNDIFKHKMGEQDKVGDQDKVEQGKAEANENTYEKDINEGELINIEKNLADLDQDRDFFIYITNSFLDNAKNQVKNLENALKTENYEEIAQQAHAIKGGALNLAAEPLAGVSRELETWGKEKNSEQIGNTIKKLEALIIDTQKYLNEKMNK